MYSYSLYFLPRYFTQTQKLFFFFHFFLIHSFTFSSSSYFPYLISRSPSLLHIFHLSKTLPNSKGFFEIRYVRRKLKRKKNREEKKKKQHRKRKRRRRRDAAAYQHRGVEKTMGNLGKRETHQR